VNAIGPGATAHLDSPEAPARQPGANRTASAAPRQTTILTAGLEPRADAPAQPQPDQPKPQPQPKPEQPKPEQPKPEQPKPEPPKEDPCKDIVERIEELAELQEKVRQNIPTKEIEIASREKEIERLKSEPTNVPFIPGRPFRGPLKFRGEIPPLAKDIEEVRRSRNILNSRNRIRVLEREIAELKKEREELREQEKQLTINLDILAKRLAECEAAKG
jgi:hypothetical protein